MKNIRGLYNIKKLYLILGFGLILLLGIGYAVLNTTLNINGVALISKSNWDVHFENIVISEGNITPTTPPTISDSSTEVSFVVPLSKPGDNYSFLVDIVNDGSFDARLSEILKTGVTSENEKYLIFDIKYSDGQLIGVNDALRSKSKKTILVTVGYNREITNDELVTTDESVSLSLKMNYVQDDGTALDVKKTLYRVARVQAVLDNIASKYVTASTGINFSSISSDTNGKGVYTISSTSGDEYPIHYYRGAVETNNVLFAGFCWKIVRTTETGGIKLIYNGISTDGKCNNTESATQIASQVKYSTKARVEAGGYSYGTSHTFSYTTVGKVSNGTIFSNDVSYVDGKYVLDENRYIKDDDFATTKEDVLKTHHYTCQTTTDEPCETVKYTYMIRDQVLFFVTLSNGEKIEDVLDNEFTNSSNTNSSNIKTTIDTWYSNNMTNYTSYLEDTVFCNDRSIGIVGGWDKNGFLNDETDKKLNYKTAIRILTDKKPTMICENKSDRFTVDDTINGNGALTYPVGLLTLDEAAFAGFVWHQLEQPNTDTYLYNGKVWWTMSPTMLSAGNVYVGIVASSLDNVHTAYITGDTGGVRPSISLKHTTTYTSGDGTQDNPYIVN